MCGEVWCGYGVWECVWCGVGIWYVAWGGYGVGYGVECGMRCVRELHCISLSEAVVNQKGTTDSCSSLSLPWCVCVSHMG